jgi:hypothetical protein
VRDTEHPKRRAARGYAHFDRSVRVDETEVISLVYQTSWQHDAGLPSGPAPRGSALARTVADQPIDEAGSGTGRRPLTSVKLIVHETKQADRTVRDG